MPLLQVRDIPEDLYEKLSRVAEADNQNMTFKWTFDDDVDTIHKNSTPFYKIFNKKEEHTIGLEVTYNATAWKWKIKNWYLHSLEFF